MAAFSGLENTSPRIPLVKPSEIPPVGTYETDRSTIVASVPLAGIYPPFGSYEVRDTTGYIGHLPGHESPDALYDPEHKLGKTWPTITSTFKDTVVRFPPYKANTDLAPCDYADIKVWAPTCAVKKPATARQRNKTVAMLLQRMNKTSIDSTRGIYKGPKISARGRANGYTIDVNGNIFEKSGDTVPCRVTTAVGCLGPAEPKGQRFCGANFAVSGKVFSTVARTSHGNNNPVVMLEKSVALNHPDMITSAFPSTFPGMRNSQVFREQLRERQARASKNLYIEQQIRNVTDRHEKLLDQYLHTMPESEKTPIGFGSTTERADVFSTPNTGDEPAASLDNGAPFMSEKASAVVQPEVGFLSKSPRFKEESRDIPCQPFMDPPAFLNTREQIQKAQTHINAAFGSSTTRTSVFAPKDDQSPTPKLYSLPTTIRVSVRNEHSGKGQFPWQGWKHKESGFKKHLDRVPPPGWYDVEGAFKKSHGRKSFHRPYLSHNPPAFESSAVRRASFLKSYQNFPAANLYNCNRWEKTRKAFGHGSTFPKMFYRSIFNPKPSGTPGPADHHISRAMLDSLAKPTFNIRYPNPYRRPWTQVHPKIRKKDYTLMAPD